MSCYACICDTQAGSVAFLAGIAFANDFNDEALKKYLCAKHQETLVKSTLGARDSIPAEDRRVK